MAIAKPVKTRPDPSVARIAGRPKNETRIPFIKPEIQPTSTAAKIARASQVSDWDPDIEGSAKCVRIKAAVTAEKFATPTTDRSIPPVIIVIVIANASIANSGN